MHFHLFIFGHRLPKVLPCMGCNEYPTDRTSGLQCMNCLHSFQFAITFIRTSNLVDGRSILYRRHSQHPKHLCWRFASTNPRIFFIDSTLDSHWSLYSSVERTDLPIRSQDRLDSGGRLQAQAAPPACAGGIYGLLNLEPELSPQPPAHVYPHPQAWQPSVTGRPNFFLTQEQAVRVPPR